MTESEIKANISQRLGIAKLNAMQKAVAATTSHKIVRLAPTGSGKTIAFAIALLRSLGKESGKGVQGVVMAPSRELVLQINDVVKRLATGYKPVAFYGGHRMQEEVNSLSQTPDIIIATPGRLLDHLQRRTVDISRVRALVIDEYDKSLELGFLGEMEKIARRMRQPSDIVLTSATALSDVPKFIDLRGAETIDCTDNEAKAKAPRLNIARIESPSRDKADTLVELLRSLPNGKVLVFVNHRESAERTCEIVKKAGLPAGLYHGGLEQNDREKAVRMLDNGSMPILITTDLASRGLDIEGLSAVVHYHLPESAEAWTHRNGRTARAGATGDVYVITSEGDNIPEYVVWDHDYNPSGKSAAPIRAEYATLHFNAGKKEKISRGDIVGYLCQKGGLKAEEIGKIDLSDHQALAAVVKDKAREAVKALGTEKIKGQRVRVSIIEL